MTTRSLRCSSLPLVAACPAAAAPCQVRVEQPDDAARLGSAEHEIQVAVVRGEAFDFDAVACRWRVDRDDLSRLVAYGRRCWLAVQGYFPLPRTEAGFTSLTAEGWELTGHLDVLSVDGAAARIADWKSGWAEGDHDAQLKGYAKLVFDNHAEVESVWAAVIRLRDMTLDAVTYARAEIDAWWAGLAERLRDQSTFVPGPHCLRCPHAATCPGKTALLIQSARVLAQAADQDLVMLPADPAERGSLFAAFLDAAKVYEAWAAHARALVKADVATHGGRLPTAEGRELRIVEQKRTEIDFAAAWDLLFARFTPEEVGSLVRVSKSKVEALVKERAPRGEKGLAVKEFLDQLDEAGALTVQTTQRLEVKRVPQPAPQLEVTP